MFILVNSSSLAGARHGHRSAVDSFKASTIGCSTQNSRINSGAARIWDQFHLAVKLGLRTMWVSWAKPRKQVPASLHHDFEGCSTLPWEA